MDMEYMENTQQNEQNPEWTFYHYYYVLLCSVVEGVVEAECVGFDFQMDLLAGFGEFKFHQLFVFVDNLRPLKKLQIKTFQSQLRFNLSSFCYSVISFVRGMIIGIFSVIFPVSFFFYFQLFVLFADIFYFHIDHYAIGWVCNLIKFIFLVKPGSNSIFCFPFINMELIRFILSELEFLLFTRAISIIIQLISDADDRMVHPKHFPCCKQFLSMNQSRFFIQSLKSQSAIDSKHIGLRFGLKQCLLFVSGASDIASIKRRFDNIFYELSWSLILLKCCRQGQGQGGGCWVMVFSGSMRSVQSWWSQFGQNVWINYCNSLESKICSSEIIIFTNQCQLWI